MSNKNYSKKEIKNILIVIKYYMNLLVQIRARKRKKLLVELLRGVPEKNLHLINGREKVNREEHSTLGRKIQ